MSDKKRRQDIRGWFRTESKTTGATPKEAEEKSSKASPRAVSKGSRERKTQMQTESRHMKLF